MSASIIDFVNCHTEKELGNTKYINDKFLDVKELNGETIYQNNVLVATQTQIDILQQEIDNISPSNPNVWVNGAGETSTNQQILFTDNSVNGAITSDKLYFDTENNFIYLNGEVMPVRSEIGSLQTQINGLGVSVNSNTSSINDLGVLVNSQGSTINNLGVSINSLNSISISQQSQINTLNQNVLDLQEEDGLLQRQINDLGSDITTNTNNINTLNGRVGTLEGQVSVQQGDINYLTTISQQSQTDITTLQGQVQTNTFAIQTLQTNVSNNTTDISTLQTNVSNNTNDIIDLQGDLNNLSTYTSNSVSSLQSQITTNTSSINNLGVDVNNQGTTINSIGALTNTNTSNIATNTSNIATNTSNIATNTSNITTNTSNITTNTSNIATNTSNITTNTSNITQLQTQTTSLQTYANSSLMRAINCNNWIPTTVYNVVWNNLTPTEKLMWKGGDNATIDPVQSATGNYWNFTKSLVNTNKIGWYIPVDLSSLTFQDLESFWCVIRFNTILTNISSEGSLYFQITTSPATAPNTFRTRINYSNPATVMNQTGYFYKIYAIDTITTLTTSNLGKGQEIGQQKFKMNPMNVRSDLWSIGFNKLVASPTGDTSAGYTLAPIQSISLQTASNINTFNFDVVSIGYLDKQYNLFYS